jgi:hypothetical protein
MLESVGACSFIHRDVYTPPEALELLKQWSTRRYAHWSVLYVASHGSRSTIYLGGRNEVSLDELGDVLEGRCHNRVLYFGSCSVLTSRRESEQFLTRTQASHLIGYERDVDWTTAAAFEVALFAALGRYTRVGDALNFVQRDATASLAKALRFIRYPRTD